MHCIYPTRDCYCFTLLSMTPLPGASRNSKHRRGEVEDDPPSLSGALMGAYIYLPLPPYCLVAVETCWLAIALKDLIS